MSERLTSRTGVGWSLLLCFVLSMGEAATVADASDLLMTIPPILAANSRIVPPPPLGSGHITYTVSFSDNHHQVYRLSAEAGALPENISTALNKLSPVSVPFDRSLNISPDGAWLVLETNRFDTSCDAWECLALIRGDLSAGDVVRADGNLVHVEGWSAVASSGNFIVYTFEGTKHVRDLWSIRRADNASPWGKPVNLSATSSFAYNQWPSVAADGNKIIFKCGHDSYEKASICEVNKDGSGFRVAVSATQVNGSTFLNSPDYAPDGSIVFEEAETTEQIWRMIPGQQAAINISGQVFNDNSPCVLPDGRIVSQLYRSIHEIKVMDADGRNPEMLFEGVDVADIGMGCGQ